MYICYSIKKIKNNKNVNEEIKRAIREKRFIYYDREKNVFLNEYDSIVDVNGKQVLPTTGVLFIDELVEALEKHGAIIPNNIKSINMIIEWYKYIEPIRKITHFNGKDLNENHFLEYLFELYGSNPEVFFKTSKKDFNGMIDLSELFNPESDLRKAIDYHLEDEFIISEKVEVDQDELGDIEYRVFVFDGKIMNISRITDITYHKIPKEVLDFAQYVINSLPNIFPKTFTLDIFSYQAKLDILEFNPLEASGKYLYNTLFEFSNDLLHNDIKNVPSEKDKSSLSFKPKDNLMPSTLSDIEHSFSKDYNDIKKYGTRVEGFVHVSGKNPGKINVLNILKSISDETLREFTDTAVSDEYTKMLRLMLEKSQK